MKRVALLDAILDAAINCGSENREYIYEILRLAFGISKDSDGIHDWYWCLADGDITKEQFKKCLKVELRGLNKPNVK